MYNSKDISPIYPKTTSEKTNLSKNIASKTHIKGVMTINGIKNKEHDHKQSGKNLIN